MKLGALFLLPDRRLRPTWRALLFVPAGGLLVFLSFFVALLLIGGLGLPSNFVVQFGAWGAGELVGATFAAWVFLRALDRRSFRTLGLWFYAGWGREVVVGLGLGLALMTVNVGLLLAAGGLEIRGLALEGSAALGSFAAMLLFLLLPAAGEELVFRGYFFQRVVEAWGPVAAVGGLSLLFGLVHWRNPQADLLSTLNTALAGVLLAVAYLKTRGLWLPIGLHLSWNFSMGFLYSLPVSGIRLPQKLLDVGVAGPAWLSGGNYGPEGSILCTAVLAAGSLWLAHTRRVQVAPAQVAALEGNSNTPPKAVE
ncbi:MAG: CPBP family intramembrane metalloprotease [Acidobacteria bacterium]|nr:CPBP family intramembrane metalloprotease [Acidobacteriota bacterium]